jgi:hypothetical protein
MNFDCIITQGKQIASGLNLRYTSVGTIKPQLPLFEKKAIEGKFDLPIELSSLHHGTINAEHGINWQPNIQNCPFFFENITWFDGMRLNGKKSEHCVKTEDFFLIPAIVLFEGLKVNIYIYLPSPNTKESPDQNEYIRFEILAPKLKNIEYGKSITVTVDDSYIIV